jgi:NADP-dependent 3-hydroxy acid dehydrogenase YdfG
LAGFGIRAEQDRIRVMPVSLKDESVLVVGASSGIGRCAAVLFAQEGARVMASARRRDRLEQLKAELAAKGHTISTFAADASDPAQMEALAAQATVELGRVDILVYVTGTNTPDRSMQRLTVPLWNELVQVNLNGAFYITQALLPAMRVARKGYLIYVGSISGKVPDVSGAAYQASKRGLLGMAHAIRVEERQNGIRTCVVCPGLVDTEILEKRPVKPAPEVLAQALQPDDVAETILDIARMHPRVTVPEIEVMPTTL